MKWIPAAFCVILGIQAVDSRSVSHVATKSPVEKVVELLRDLKTKIEADGQTEQQTYDKFACWCEKTTDRKAQSITTAQGDLRTLGQSILGLKGTVATRMTEIADLTSEIKTNEEAQAEATSIRQTENGQYMAETAEMKEVLAALSKAIEVLREGTGTSFLQQGAGAAAAVRRVVEALPTTVAAKPEQLSLLRAFASAKQGYAPQSATIMGILGDMFDTFSGDLETTTETEGRKNQQFETFMSEKATQLQALQEDLQTKEREKSEAEIQLADSTQIYDDTEAQLNADIVFFDETKASCESKHSEWVTRSQLRTEELAGITQALDILSSDSARELFASAIKPGKETGVDTSYDPNVSFTTLLQFSEGSAPANHAYAALKKSASSAHSLRLAALAAKLRMADVGHFDQVIAAIDTMMTTLKDEGAEDIKKRDQCKDQYQKINSTIADVSWKIKKNKAKIQKLEDIIEDLRTQKTETAIAINATATQISEMTSQRTAENQAFLQAKKEDQDAIALLSQARDVLSAYYTNHSIELGPIQGVSMAQRAPDFEVSADQAPDATFSSKGKRKFESKGIISILTMIMEDLRDEIRNGMKAEESAQLAYEQQLAAANQLKSDLEAKEISLQGMIATRTGEKDDENTDMGVNTQDKQDEETYRTQIQPDCDWIIGAFETRAKKRAAEMDGLVAAKDFLAGYQAPAQSVFLEKPPVVGFDDSALANINFHSITR